MVKAKFGDAVRSKTDMAIRNEALTKLLCHNIVVVHPSALELGMELVFWQDGTDDGPRDVLRFPVNG